MKKFFLITLCLSIFCFVAPKANAQPRSFGVRMGTAFEASLQYSFAGDNFMQFDLGLDIAGKKNGLTFSTSYNFILAQPALTDVGGWTIYAGPGVNVGYLAPYFNADKNGATADVFLQLGLEYSPIDDFAISVDIRPHYGYNSLSKNYVGTNYYGLIPSLGLKLKF